MVALEMPRCVPFTPRAVSNLIFRNSRGNVTKLRAEHGKRAPRRRSSDRFRSDRKTAVAISYAEIARSRSRASFLVR